MGIRVRVLKYKNVFAKGYAPNSSAEVFVINKIKNIVSWTYVINDFNGEKLYVKCKGYDNSFNSWMKKMMLYKNESIHS